MGQGTALQEPALVIKYSLVHLSLFAYSRRMMKDGEGFRFRSFNELISSYEVVA